MGILHNKTNKEVKSKYNSDIAFSKAISKASIQELKNLLLRRSKHLLPFEEVKEKLELWYVRDLGLKSVPINSIVGSQGRYKNFTRH